MAKMDAKKWGKVTLLGTGVVVLQPLITPFVAGLHEFLADPLVLGLSLASIIGAGVAAFGVQWAIERWLP